MRSHTKPDKFIPGLALGFLLLCQCAFQLAGNELKLGKKVGLSGSTVWLPVTFTGGSNIVAAQFDVIFATNLFTSGAAVADPGLHSFTVDSNEIRQGARRIIIYSLPPLPLPSGQLLTLPFAIPPHLEPMAADFILTNAIFSNAQAQRVTDVALIGGSVAINPATSDRFSSVAYDPQGVLHLRFTGIDGQRYVFQTSSNLAVWTPLSTNTANGGQVNLSISNHPAAPHGFYRALQAPD